MHFFFPPPRNVIADSRKNTQIHRHARPECEGKHSDLRVWTFFIARSPHLRIWPLVLKAGFPYADQCLSSPYSKKFSAQTQRCFIALAGHVLPVFPSSLWPPFAPASQNCFKDRFVHAPLFWLYPKWPLALQFCPVCLQRIRFDMERPCDCNCHLKPIPVNVMLYSTLFVPGLGIPKESLARVAVLRNILRITFVTKWLEKSLWMEVPDSHKCWKEGKETLSGVSGEVTAWHAFRFATTAFQFMKYMVCTHTCCRICCW